MTSDFTPEPGSLVARQVALAVAADRFERMTGTTDTTKAIDTILALDAAHSVLRNHPDYVEPT